MKNYLYVIFGVGIGIGLVPLAIFIQWSVPDWLDHQAELLGILAFIEEFLKWGASVVLFYLGTTPLMPVAIALGFGINEFFSHVVFKETPVYLRLNPIAFHIFTGIFLWLGTKRNKLWIVAILIINTLLHWLWNLYFT